MDNFALQQASKEILSLFGRFKSQWESFLLKMEKLGKKIQAVQEEYDSLMASRRKNLDRILEKIEEERASQSCDLEEIR